MQTTRREPEITKENLEMDGEILGWRGTRGNTNVRSSTPYWRPELDDPDGIPLESAGDLPAELADQSARADPDPVMLRADCLLLPSDPVATMPGQTLNDQGAQAEQQGQQSRIKPG
jgi:hypothetical protein